MFGIRRSNALAHAIVLGLLCASAWGQSQTFYTLRELEGTLGAHGQDLGFVIGGKSCAYAINDDGVVVGSAERYRWDSQLGQYESYPSELAVMWDNPDVSVGLVGTIASRAVDINESGMIVTQFLNASWQEGFGSVWGGQVRIDGGAMVVTDPLGQFAEPTAVNELGQVVANGLHGDNEAVSYTLTDTGAGWNWQTLPAEETYAINDLGQGAGTTWVDVWNDSDELTYLSLHGYLDSTDLGHLWTPPAPAVNEPPASAMTVPQDVNNLGMVVGDSTYAEYMGHAFAWQAGQMTDLGTLGGDESLAKAVNDLGIVVGTAQTAGGESRAFAWQQQLGMVDLNLFAPAAEMGLVLETAMDINNNGQIVGRARNEFGQQKGFVMSPAAFLEGASAAGSFDPEGFSPDQFPLAGLPDLAEGLGGLIDLDNFLLLEPSATLSIAYDEAILAAMGVSEDDIRLFWFDETNQQWVLAGAQSNLGQGGSFVLGAPTDVLGDFGVDTEANLVWANIDHASTYGVFSVPEPTGVTLLVAASAGLMRRRRRS